MIPITVVTGFLGSGKTSLLAHILDSTPERRIAVILNDMAPRSIDGAFLRGGEFLQLDDDPLVRTIAGGRIGAGKRDSLVEEIVHLVTAEHKPDAILVETSGSSPALSLEKTLSRAPELAGLVRLDSVIAVVDTEMLPSRWSDRMLKPLLIDQIGTADLVVLNKFDRAGRLARIRSRMILRSIGKHAVTVAAEFGRLDPTDVLDTNRRDSFQTSIEPINLNHHPLTARQLEEFAPFDPTRLHRWLDAEWPGIVRIKGFLWLATDMDHVYVLDAAGNQRELGMEGTWYAAVPSDELPSEATQLDALIDKPYKDRRQSITVIGRPEAVEREMKNLRAALLSRTEMDRGPTGWASLDDPITPQFREEEYHDDRAPGSE